MILKYIEILYGTFCIRRAISGCCLRTNEYELRILATDFKKKIYKVFKKSI